MTDFDDMQASYQLQDASDAMWSTSIGFQQMSSDLWVHDNTYDALIAQQAADQAEYFSHQFQDLSWDAYDGPVNAEGYTAYDAAHGYTTSDTSLIEPATSAGSCSLISSNDATSSL